MSINVASRTGINAGRRDIPTSLIPPVTNTSSPWVRPIDWPALSEVGPTDTKFSGLYAIADNDNNNVALAFSMTGHYSGYTGVINDTIFSLGVSGTVNQTGLGQAGQIVQGTGVVPNTVITASYSTTINGNLGASGNVLTVSTISGDPIIIGTCFAFSSGYRVITGFITGTGGTGTYTYSGAGTTTSVVNVSGWYAVVNNSQSIGSFASPQGSMSAFTPGIIDWGDGTIETVGPNTTATPAQHQYNYNTFNGPVLASGYKAVVITMTCPVVNAGFSSINLQVKYTTAAGYPTRPKYIAKWLDISLGSPSLTTLTIGANTIIVDLGWLEQVNIMSTASTSSIGAYLFMGCARLESVPTLALGPNWNCTSTFSGCSSLKIVPKLPPQTQFNGISTYGMFNGCYSLETATDEAFSDILSINSTSLMFNNCNSLRIAPNLNFRQNAMNTGSMFANCYNLVSVPAYNFGITGLSYASSMFAQCTSLKTIPLMNFKSVVDVSSMFAGCGSLVSVPALDLSAVGAGASSMFSGCGALETTPPFDLSSCTTMSNMFNNCYSLFTIGTIKTSNKLLNTSTMFNNCYNIEKIPVFDTTGATTVNNMFAGCRSLTSGPAFDFSKATSFSNMFSGCWALSNMSAFNGVAPLVTDMNTMFNQCYALEICPDLTTSNVTTMANMFSNCFSLQSIPVLDTAKVTTMLNMFTNCYNFNRVTTWSGWNTSNVTIMGGMFNNCSSIINIPANWDTSKVTTIAGTFTGCLSLERIPAWNLSAVTVAAGVLSTTNLSTIKATNLKTTCSVAGSSMSKAALEEFFDNLRPNISSTQTITITGAAGVDNIISSGILTAGQSIGTTTLTVSNSSAYAVGEYIVLAQAFPTILVTTQADVNTVTRTAHGIPIGTMVSFQQMPMSNVSPVMFVRYYVINATANTFQLSLERNSSIVVPILISQSSAILLRIEIFITDIPSSTQITVNAPTAAVTTAVGLPARILHTNIALFQNWTITG